MATTRSSAAKPPLRGKAPAKKPIGPESSPLSSVPVKYHTWIFIGLILLSLLIFFGGVIFSNQIFGASDFVSWESFRPYLNSMDAKGEPPLWIPYIFSGMPAFASYLVTGDRWWDLTMKLIYSSEHIFGVVNYPVMRVVMHYFIYGIGMYLLMRSRKAARSTSAWVALAAIFSAWIIVYIMIGHNTKILTLMALPYIFLCLDKLTKRWSLLYAGLLIVAVHVLWEGAQLNTAFYGACAVGIYLLVELIGSLASKTNVMGVVRAGLLLIVAAGFTYGMGLDRNMEREQYVPYSTRGSQAITAEKNSVDGDASHGYDYATGWSFSPEEMITYLVPNYFGSGKMKIPAEVVRSLPSPYNQNPEDPKMVYWGQMSFTDTAHYMGIAVLILGIFGFWMNRRSRFAQAMLGIGIFGLLLSFGKNFPVLFDFFYNMVPSFNKLRAPSQSLVLLEFAFPILAGLGIESLIAMHKAKDNAPADKSILYGAFGFGGLMLILLLIVNSSYAEAVASSKSLAAASSQITQYMVGLTTQDTVFSLVFGVGTLLLMYYYLKHRITPTAFKLALFLILFIDLWRVDYRPMETQPASMLTSTFAPTDVDRFLKQDTSEQYRVLDVTTPQPNFLAYQFHQHILGYSSAKMRNYQDLLDVAGTNGNVPTSPLAWNLLNTKYIIAQGPIAEGMQPVFVSKEKQAQVFENTNMMPRAWFVNRVEVADGLTILNKIKDNGFDPRDVAYIPDSSKGVMAGISPVSTAPKAPAAGDTTAAGDSTTQTPATTTSGGGSAHITRYEPLHIAMDVEAPGPEKNFLVVSEIYYPPAWRATIDGKPAQIVQTNYLLRGLVVPAGRHKIEMNYVSEGFETGKWTSLALNIAAFAAIAVGVILERRKPQEIDPEHEGPMVDEDDV